MLLPEYISIDEVQRVCREIGLSDWTTTAEPDVTIEEARIILGLVNIEGMDIDPEEFRDGLEVELEHGLRFADANVTNNHPVLTGKIVLAHLKESLYYYRLLEVAELEGDLLKAIAAGKSEKTTSVYKRLIAARNRLSQTEEKRLS